MVKKFKLNGKQKNDSLAVDIGGKVYNIPLAKSMKLKELRSLKDEDSVFAFFEKHLGSDVMDELTTDEYSQIVDAWTEANQENEGVSLGES